MKEKNLQTQHLIFGLGVGCVASYAVWRAPYLGKESAFMLAVFNFLFVSLVFPLNGTLSSKLFMLLLGNVAGGFWNYVFSLFTLAIMSYLGTSFNTLLIILNPFVNLIWIVPFWSLSLTVLASSNKGKKETQT